jgi:hypothetical protein
MGGRTLDIQFFFVPKVLIEPAHTNSFILCAFNRISMHTECILCAINVIGVHVVYIVCAACMHYTDPMHDNEHCNSKLQIISFFQRNDNFFSEDHQLFSEGSETATIFRGMTTFFRCSATIALEQSSLF